MRLINTSTLELHEFAPSDIPQYAILSHTWENEEVTFADLTSGHRPAKDGYTKIAETCQLAQRNGLDYVWVDTCCIDRTSSAELSEAINSMYRWYQESHVCYVYLADVPAGADEVDLESSHFRNSRWFSRGWTLQELIAPKTVQFYNQSWTHLGERSQLSDLIEQICGVPRDLFPQRNLMEYSIAQRMSWAAARSTTREEDVSYCLLGLFGVNMPLLYGESKEKAFQRLQEAIIKQSDDQSIFAWGFGKSEDELYDYCDWDTKLSPLAKAPHDFAGCHEIVPCNAWVSREPVSAEITGQGIRVALPIQYTKNFFRSLALLNCRLSDDFTNVLAIPVCVPSPIPWSRRPLRDWLEPYRFDNIGRCAVRPTLFPVHRGFFAEPKLKLLHFAGLSTASIMQRNLSGSIRIQTVDHTELLLLDSDHPLDITTKSAGSLFIREEGLSSRFKPPRRAFYVCHSPGSPTIPLFYMMVEFARHRVWSNLFMLRERDPRVRLSRPLPSGEMPTCQNFRYFEWRSAVDVSGGKVQVVASRHIGTGISMNTVRLERPAPWRLRKRWSGSIGRFFVFADDTYHFHATPAFSSFPWPVVYLFFGAMAICLSLECISWMSLKAILCFIMIGNLLFSELLIQTIDRKYGSRGFWVWSIVFFFAAYLVFGVGIFALLGELLNRLAVLDSDVPIVSL